MAALTLRIPTGIPLTNQQLDDNFSNLNTAKAELASPTFTGTVSGITAAMVGAQPLDADLTAIAALAGTTGLLKKTALDTWSLDTTAYTTNLGTVTSVGGTGTVSGLTLSGSVTTSGNLTLGGTLAVTAANFASQTANTFLSAPTGIAGVPTFRAIVAADIPTLNQNTTGTSANVTGTVAVANGGTGATTAALARTGLGATTLGANLFILTNVAAISFPRINADNTVSSLDAATFRTAIGAGTSSTTGTVTSVGGTGTVSGLTLSGSVTTSGNLTLGGTLAVTAANFASQTANTFLSAPTGIAGVPTFRAIVAADIPTLNQNTTGTSANVTGTVAVANGGTGSITAGAALTALGAQPLDADLTAIAALAGTTGLLKKTALNTWSLDTAAYTTNLGTVTSVGGTGTVSGLTLSGSVTTSGNLTLGGTLAVTAANFASQTANTFLSAPTGIAGVPTFRAIVAADIPTLNQNTTGTAANVTGTVAVANGGTGATDAATARTNLGTQATLVSATNIKTLNGFSILGSGDLVLSGGMTYTTKTSAYTAVKNDYIYANTATSAFTVTLPLTPAAGDTVIVADMLSTFNTKSVTVARNSSTIEGVAGDYTLNSANLEYTFSYIGGTWKVYSKSLQPAGTGNTYLTGPTTGNEGSNISLEIKNWSAAAIYTVSVSAGTYTQTTSNIVWTLPSVTVDTVVTLTLTIVGTGSYTYNVNVIDISTIVDTSISVTDFSLADSSIGWTI